MNESEFEQELRALRPAEPSPTLAKRIAAELPTHAIAVTPSRALPTPAAGIVVPVERRSALLGLLRGLLWASGGAAVASFILLSREPKVVPPAPSVASVEETNAVVASVPEQSVSELIGTTDEGVIYDPQSPEPQRQVRYSYIERHTWTNPQTGAVIEFEVPREDIVLMPVAMQ